MYPHLLCSWTPKAALDLPQGSSEIPVWPPIRVSRGPGDLRWPRPHQRAWRASRALPSSAPPAARGR
eukprot:8610609-Pyramimonas_sp.AAC.1